MKTAIITRVYHGLFRKRKDVSAVLKTMLPEKALVIFAHAIERESPSPDGGPSEFFVDLLVAWTIDRKFFVCNGQAIRFYDPMKGGYVQSPFQLRDGRIHNPKETLEALDNEAEKHGWPTAYKLVFRDMFKRIVRMQEKWDESLEQFTEVAEEPVPALPAVSIAKPCMN